MKSCKLWVAKIDLLTIPDGRKMKRIMLIGNEPQCFPGNLGCGCCWGNNGRDKSDGPSVMVETIGSVELDMVFEEGDGE